MVSYTADMFMTLDGFRTGPVGYWGKEGPELVAHRAHVFFARGGETLVFGANTYRAMEGLPLSRAKAPSSSRSPSAERS